MKFILGIKSVCTNTRKIIGGSFIKDDEWSGEPQLYSFQKWYEIKVLIKYIIDDVEYSKTVTVNYEDKHLPTDFLLHITLIILKKFYL